MSRYFTSRSNFFTICPDDINNSTSFRLSMFFQNNLSLASKPLKKRFMHLMVDNKNIMG